MQQETGGLTGNSIRSVSPDEGAQTALAEDVTLETYLGRGLQLEERGSYEEALKLYDEAQERFPDDPRAVHKQGVILVRMGRRDEARQAFIAALNLNREFAPSLTNLGNMELEQGHVEQAIVYYKQAIAAQPDYPGAHHNLGVAYRKLGRLGDAVSEARQAARHERRQSREEDRLKLHAHGGCMGRSAIVLALGAGAAAAVPLVALHVHV